MKMEGVRIKAYFLLLLALARMPLQSVSVMLMHGFYKSCVTYKHGSNNHKSGRYKKSM